MLEITISQGPKNNARGRRVQLAPDADALRAALDSAPSSRESWWSVHTWRSDYRRQSDWESAAGVMVDLDYVDTKGEHAAIPPDFAERLSENITGIPGNLWHPSPRGARVVFMFSAPCEDAELFEAAGTGAGVLVERAVRKLGLAANPGAGLEIDTSGLRDRARFMYAPKALVGEIQRDACVEVITGNLWTPRGLADVKPEATTESSAPRAPRSQSAPPRPTSGSRASDDLAQAAANYNASHAREWPRSDADCPICGHRGCFGRLPSAPDRWACWSASHSEIGVKGERCWHGDALDVDAYAAGRSRVEHLRAEGFLVDRARTQRQPEPPPPDDTDAPSQAPGISADYVTSTSAGWPDPEPITDELLPVLPLRPEIIPEPLRAWIVDEAYRLQCPLDFVAVPAIIALGTVIGRQVAIRPLEKDSWHEFANLWGMAIGQPSERKSPAMSAALSPLERLIAIETEALEPKKEQFARDLMVAKAKQKVLEKQLGEAIRRGHDTSEYQAQIEDLPEPPEPRRFRVADCTVEKLGDLLVKNPLGLMLSIDELATWLRGLDREGHQTERGFYLSGWSGKASHDVDRIARGTLHIPAVCLSVFGTIQPGVWSEYLREALKSGAGSDGLVQRFQLAVWPDSTRSCEVIDRWPDHEAKRRAANVYATLADIKAVELGASFDEFNPIPYLRFAPDAQPDAKEILRAHRNRWHHSEEEHPALVSHFVKMEKTICSLALLFHLALWVEHRQQGGISAQALLMALGWMEYLESHARRIYGCATSAGTGPLVMLSRKLAAGAMADGFTARDLAKRHWAGIDAASADNLLSELAERGWVRKQRVTTKGRPRDCWFVNPSAKAAKHEKAA